eukprot:8772-Heterococcus_DN1.PRE.2
MSCPGVSSTVTADTAVTAGIGSAAAAAVAAGAAAAGAAAAGAAAVAASVVADAAAGAAVVSDSAAAARVIPVHVKQEFKHANRDKLYQLLQAHRETQSCAVNLPLLLLLLSAEVHKLTVRALITCVMPAASPCTMQLSGPSRASSSVVLPWLKWPKSTSTGVSCCVRRPRNGGGGSVSSSSTCSCVASVLTALAAIVIADVVTAPKHMLADYG